MKKLTKGMQIYANGQEIIIIFNTLNIMFNEIKGDR